MYLWVKSTCLYASVGFYQGSVGAVQRVIHHALWHQLAVQLLVFHSIDGALTEVHLILCERTRFVSENILHLGARSGRAKKTHETRFKGS